MHLITIRKKKKLIIHGFLKTLILTTTSIKLSIGGTVFFILADTNWKSLGGLALGEDDKDAYEITGNRVGFLDKNDGSNRCKAWCDAIPNCNSISHDGANGGCWLKNMCVTETTEKRSARASFETYYKQKCYGGKNLLH